ncbi:MAG TPA: hypothetical protein VNC41_04580 [Acidimicrobiia bacterium]|nr:hypothetical protein [Acidimicrobiia bacterium]
MSYSAPVRRQTMALLVVAAVFVATVVFLGAIFSNRSYGGAFTSALLITGVVLSGGTFVVLLCMMPTRIEVDVPATGAGQIRLISPRTTSRYVPSEMTIRPEPNGDFALVRTRTGRKIAAFIAPDPAAAMQAFGSAGAQIPTQGI